MTDLKQNQLIRWERQLPIFINYLLVGLMMVCLTATLSGALAAVQPGWDGGTYLGVVTFVVALESLYSARATRRTPVLSREWIAYRFSEIVSILVLLKLLIYVLRGFGQLAVDLPLWQQNFFASFFTGEYLLACLVVLGVYVLCAQFGGNLLEQEADDELLERERQNEFRVDRVALHRRLAFKVMALAAGMIIVAVLTQGYLRLIAITPATGSAANLMWYVLLGFILLSLTRYTAMRAAWYRERAAIHTGITLRWALYVVGFLIAVALLAGLLPTRYTVGLLQMLQYALGALVTVLQLIIYVLIFLLTLPLSLLMRLLGHGPIAPAPPAGPIVPKSLSPQLPPAANPLLDFIQSLLFWAIFAIVTAYALKQFFGRHRALADALRRAPVLRWLAQGLSQLWAWLHGVSGRLAIVVDAGLKRLRTAASDPAPVSAPPARLSLRRMTPRQRVQFYYLAMLRRGEQRGVGRKPAQTPREYAATLEAAVPEVDRDIDALTDSFSEARYSRHDITPAQAGRVQSAWERVRRAFRNRNKKQETRSKKQNAEDALP